MRKAGILLFLLLFWRAANAQVVSVTNPGNTTPALAATYTSLANAFTALNGITAISGPVTITLNASNPQSAPAGGYIVSVPDITTHSSYIVINGNGNIITAFSPQPAGFINDAIFKIIGSDHISIENFVLQENPANTITVTASNNMTEWGIAILPASGSNGSQNNTIHGNTISLSRAYANSFGIYSNASHSFTNPSVNMPLLNNTTAPNHNNVFTNNNISNVNAGIAVIGSANADRMDSGTRVGDNIPGSGNSITNWGGRLADAVYNGNSASTYGILLNHQVDDGIYYNSVISADITGMAIPLVGIHKDYTLSSPAGTFTSSINNNQVSIHDQFSGAAQSTAILSRGISLTVPGATILIDNNLISECGLENPSAIFLSRLTGILNESICGELSISNNVFRNNIITTPDGHFDAIGNTAAVVNTININNNQLGNSSGGCVTLPAGSYSQVNGINCSNGGVNASLSISGNNFQGFTASGYSTNSYTFINVQHRQESSTIDNINNNTFTDLYLNTAELVMLISRNGSTMESGSGAITHINNNSIAGTLTKISQVSYAANLVFVYDAGSSGRGNQKFITNNDFSNVVSAGNNGVSGILSYDGNPITGGPTTFITGNVFENIQTGAIGALIIRCSNHADTTRISNNIIRNISTTSAIIGIQLGHSPSPVPDRVIVCNANTISGFTSTGNGSSVLTGIDGSSSDTRQIIYDNRITELSSGKGNTASGIRLNSSGSSSNMVYKNLVAGIVTNHVSSTSIAVGIEISATCTGESNVFNNYIGTLRAAAASGANLVRGINILSVVANSQHNIFYNTIYLNAPASTGANFGSSGIFATSDAVQINGLLTIRNNIIINVSESKGTGVTAAYRRTAGSLANFSLSSNNNIYYAGLPGPANFIYYSGISGDQTITAYQLRVGARETQSHTEQTPFLNIIDFTAPEYLHIDTLQSTFAESGAESISFVSDDFDADIRFGNVGYAGTGSAPDIGADEFNGLSVVPIHISFFHAVKIDNHYSKLLWQNESESGVHSYHIERSLNGRDFSVIHSISPLNNRAQASYNYNDLNPVKGKNFYRIISNGLNGDRSLSHIELVEFNKTWPVIFAYPNPATGNTSTIRYENVPPGQYQQSIYDRSGRKIFSETIFIYSFTGTYVLKFPPGLTEGNYILKLNSAALNLTDVILIQRK